MFKLTPKYLVLKREDIDKGLDAYDKQLLTVVVQRLLRYRREIGKTQKQYLVCRLGTPEYDAAFKILEEQDESKHNQDN